jgi:hypothetical protein
MPSGESIFMPIHEHSRTRSVLLALTAIALLFQPAAFSNPPRTIDPRSGWRAGDGQPAPDTEFRKGAHGFLGWLLVTDDENWESEWNTDHDQVPSFSEVDALAKGDSVTALILIANPREDERGNVDVSCDIHVRRADGSVSMDQKGIDCLSGPLLGSSRSVRLAAPRMVFVGEPGDPTGPWKFTVTLRDANRPATLVLTKTIILK